VYWGKLGVRAPARGKHGDHPGSRGLQFRSSHLLVSDFPRVRLGPPYRLVEEALKGVEVRGKTYIGGERTFAILSLSRTLPFFFRENAIEHLI